MTSSNITHAILACALAISVLLAGCAGFQGDATPTNNTTETPELTMTPPTPTSTSTAIPVDTPTPTPKNNTNETNSTLASAISELNVTAESYGDFDDEYAYSPVVDVNGSTVTYATADGGTYTIDIAADGSLEIQIANSTN